MKPPHAALVGLAHLLAQLPFISDYGASWDEPLHRESARRFELWWRTGDWSSFQALGLDGRYYGPLYDYLSYCVFRILHGIGVPFLPASHALNLLAASAVTALLFSFARRLFGTRAALAAVLFWVLFPPLAAHAHYNPKDVVLAGPVLLLNLAALHAVASGRARDWFATGIALGLSIAVKVAAVTAVPQVVVALVAARLVPGTRPDWRRLLREGLVAAGCAGLGTLFGLFAFWPTMWKQPTLPAVALYLRSKGTAGIGTGLYLGDYYRATELPWHYVPLWMAMVTPLPMLICAVVGALKAVRELRGERRTAASLLLAWFFVPMLLASAPGLHRYDGMRHFFFCVPALAILAGVGLVALSARAVSHGVPGWLRGTAVAGIASWLLVEVARGHPYQGSYVNELTRGLLGPHVERSLALEYWGPTYREGLGWLDVNASRDARICVPVAGHLIAWYEPRSDLRFRCGPEVEYVMLMANHPRREADIRGRTPSFTVSRYDSDLLYVYRVR